MNIQENWEFFCKKNGKCEEIQGKEIEKGNEQNEKSDGGLDAKRNRFILHCIRFCPIFVAWNGRFLVPLKKKDNIMLSKNKLKYLHALVQKKKRDAEGVFLAEGPKVVSDLLPLLRCRLLCGTATYLARLEEKSCADEVVEITEWELGQASQLQAPRDVIAVFEKPMGEAPCPEMPGRELCIALDGVRDPGNLGTIIRIADWFGVEHLLLSPDTADVFAPKVVQATMGAIGRVKFHTCHLPNFLRHLPGSVPVYGTFLEGADIYSRELTSHGVVVMGNEGNGISSEVAELVNARLYIPNYPLGRATSDSLNVAVATAVVCAEFRRRS